jgi:hypothetical protein
MSQNLTEAETVTVDDAERILRKAYRQDVIGIVSAYADALGTDVTDDESADTWMHETIDGSQRVIYTWQAQNCLLWSDNDGQYAEEFGEDGMVEDGVIQWSRLAFSAFRVDVLEELDTYGLPYCYGEFDDIDEQVDDVENALQSLADVRDDAGFEMVTIAWKDDDETVDAETEDLEYFDGDAIRARLLREVGEKVNAELKANGWF